MWENIGPKVITISGWALLIYLIYIKIVPKMLAFKKARVVSYLVGMIGTIIMVAWKIKHVGTDVFFSLDYWSLGKTLTVLTVLTYLSIESVNGFYIIKRPFSSFKWPTGGSFSYKSIGDVWKQCPLYFQGIIAMSIICVASIAYCKICFPGITEKYGSVLYNLLNTKYSNLSGQPSNLRTFIGCLVLTYISGYTVLFIAIMMISGLWSVVKRIKFNNVGHLALTAVVLYLLWIGGVYVAHLVTSGFNAVRYSVKDVSQAVSKNLPLSMNDQVALSQRQIDEENDRKASFARANTASDKIVFPRPTFVGGPATVDGVPNKMGASVPEVRKVEQSVSYIPGESWERWTHENPDQAPNTEVVFYLKPHVWTKIVMPITKRLFRFDYKCSGDMVAQNPVKGGNNTVRIPAGANTPIPVNCESVPFIFISNDSNEVQILRMYFSFEINRQHRFD